MGLDIAIKINGIPEYDFEGRQAFNPLKDYMVEKYNYEYGTDMKLTKPIIKNMVNAIMNECYKSDDRYIISWRMSHVRALMECNAVLNDDSKTIITWECDW